MSQTPDGQEHDDPVRAKRAVVAKWTLIANRMGYLSFSLAFALFVMSFAFGMPETLVSIVAALLIGGSCLLAPSMILGYAVKAAERFDREKGY